MATAADIKWTCADVRARDLIDDPDNIRFTQVPALVVYNCAVTGDLGDRRATLELREKRGGNKPSIPVATLYVTYGDGPRKETQLVDVGNDAADNPIIMAKCYAAASYLIYGKI